MNLWKRLCTTACAVAALWCGGPASPGAVAGETKTFPQGSEKAVRAVRDALPRVVIDAVEQPKGFGADPKGNAPLYWSVRFHLARDKRVLSVTPDGVIVRFPQAVGKNDLPRKVKQGLAKAAAGARVTKVEKQEIRAAIRYVALGKPEVVYLADVVKEGKKVRIRAAADGAILRTTPVKDRPAKTKAKPARGAKKKAKGKKKPNIPKAAAKAVRAVRDAFPAAEITGVEIVGYQDGTGTLDVLNYEVEYILKGVEHELNVTPEGVIIHLALPMKAKDLPRAVAAALAKKVPGGQVQRVFREEVRAGLKFVALKKPKVLYVATLEGKGAPATVKLRPDGTVVKDVNPFRKKKNEAKRKKGAKS
jgi:hypothetical protein